MLVAAFCLSALPEDELLLLTEPEIGQLSDDDHELLIAELQDNPYRVWALTKAQKKLGLHYCPDLGGTLWFPHCEGSTFCRCEERKKSKKTTEAEGG